MATASEPALPAAPGPGAGLPRGLMPVLLAGVFLAALDTAIVAPALPALRAEFDLAQREVGLVMIVFILFSLPATALMANLGDRHGRRPVFLACIGLFALGSLLIAASDGLWMLLAGRAIQGLGAGGIVPTASAMIADAYPPQQRGRMLGLVGAMYGMAFVLGPPLAALVMLAAGWHWIFLINLPVAALVLWLGRSALPATRRDGPLPALDVGGIVLVFLLLAALVLGITRVADGLAGGVVLWPWLLAAAAALLPLLLRVERGVARAQRLPMIPLDLFGRRQLRLAYLLTAGAGFGMGSVVFLASLATLAHGVSPQHAGFVLLPLVLASMLGSAGSGRLLHRAGVRRMVVAGFALLALGYAGTAVTGAGLTAFLLASVPVGLGVGVVVGGALRTVAIEESPLAQRGAAQGLVNVFTSVGTLLSSATIGALADFAGPGARGFAVAYGAVAALMAAMLLLALARRSGAAPAPQAVEASG
ncbi:MAG: MFS transporter [Pseudomonadota bacterium]